MEQTILLIIASLIIVAIAVSLFVMVLNQAPKIPSGYLGNLEADLNVSCKYKNQSYSGFWYTQVNQLQGSLYIGLKNTHSTSVTINSIAVKEGNQLVPYSLNNPITISPGGYYSVFSSAPWIKFNYTTPPNINFTVLPGDVVKVSTTSATIVQSGKILQSLGGLPINTPNNYKPPFGVSNQYPLLSSGVQLTTNFGSSGFSATDLVNNLNGAFVLTDFYIPQQYGSTDVPLYIDFPGSHDFTVELTGTGTLQTLSGINLGNFGTNVPIILGLEVQPSGTSIYEGNQVGAVATASGDSNFNIYAGMMHQQPSISGKYQGLAGISEEVVWNFNPYLFYYNDPYTYYWFNPWYADYQSLSSYTVSGNSISLSDNFLTGYYNAYWNGQYQGTFYYSGYKMYTPIDSNFIVVNNPTDGQHQWIFHYRERTNMSFSEYNMYITNNGWSVSFQLVQTSYYWTNEFYNFVLPAYPGASQYYLMLQTPYFEPLWYVIFAPYSYTGYGIAGNQYNGWFANAYAVVLYPNGQGLVLLYYANDPYSGPDKYYSPVTHTTSWGTLWGTVLWNTNNEYQYYQPPGTIYPEDVYPIYPYSAPPETITTMMPYFGVFTSSYVTLEGLNAGQMIEMSVPGASYEIPATPGTMKINLLDYFSPAQLLNAIEINGGVNITIIQLQTSVPNILSMIPTQLYAHVAGTSLNTWSQLPVSLAINCTETGVISTTNDYLKIYNQSDSLLLEVYPQSNGGNNGIYYPVGIINYLTAYFSSDYTIKVQYTTNNGNDLHTATYGPSYGATELVMSPSGAYLYTSNGIVQLPSDIVKVEVYASYIYYNGEIG